MGEGDEDLKKSLSSWEVSRGVELPGRGVLLAATTGCCKTIDGMAVVAATGGRTVGVGATGGV